MGEETVLETSQAKCLSYDDFNNEVIAINKQLIALCGKYKIKNGLDAQWYKGHYCIAQNLSELSSDPENLLALSLGFGQRNQS